MWPIRGMTICSRAVISAVDANDWTVTTPEKEQNGWNYLISAT